MAQEAWEKQPLSYNSLVKNVQEFIWELEVAQRGQKCIYNQLAQPRQFSQGDQSAAPCP